jgi:hypothetical protein
MMQYRRWGLWWWYIWLPLLSLLLWGLLILAPQGPRSPADHPIAQLGLALLVYGVVALWLQCNRRTLVDQTYERAQMQERRRAARQQQHDRVMSDHEPWDDAWPSWPNNEHDTDMQRRS